MLEFGQSTRVLAMENDNIFWVLKILEIGEILLVLHRKLESHQLYSPVPQFSTRLYPV